MKQTIGVLSLLLFAPVGCAHDGYLAGDQIGDGPGSDASRTAGASGVSGTTGAGGRTDSSGEAGEATDPPEVGPPPDPILCTVDGEPGVAIGKAAQDFETSTLPGDWLVDNGRAFAGNAAHPPDLAGAAAPAMTFDCNRKSHSQITFEYYGQPGLNAQNQSLDLFVDDALYQTLPDTFSFGVGRVWSKVTITVPSGKHSYRWQEEAPMGGASAFWVDSVDCTDTAVSCNNSGLFGFEEGYMPPEFAGPWE
ncbi:MAG: hypothetical protein ABW061_22095, partial [Polyangiaceae bacterium]